MSVGDEVDFETPTGDSVHGICTQIGDRLVAVPGANPVPDNDGDSGRDNQGIGDFSGLPYTIVGTDQSTCFDDSAALGNCPGPSDAFFGQDAHYDDTQPSYTDNGDGTVTDQRTGLMWQQDPGAKMAFSEAPSGAERFNLAGYDDWRLPTIKELYSLILFSGTDPDVTGTDTSGLVPFIDTDHFAFKYGDPSVGERIIDSQYASATMYVHTTMWGNETVFGVNFADGRIKGYGLTDMYGIRE